MHRSRGGVGREGSDLMARSLYSVGKCGFIKTTTTTTCLELSLAKAREMQTAADYTRMDGMAGWLADDKQRKRDNLEPGHHRHLIGLLSAFSPQ